MKPITEKEYCFARRSIIKTFGLTKMNINYWDLAGKIADKIGCHYLDALMMYIKLECELITSEWISRK